MEGDMVRVTYVGADGAARTIDGQDGASVMQTALSNGIEGILAECGGAASCATCHVYVDGAWVSLLPAVGEDEDAMLDCAVRERLSNSRLSCQIKLSENLDGLIVQIPGT
jgi:2Fe-2S ferredoxin